MTDKLYIKMCEASEEIQALWDVEDGDLMFWNGITYTLCSGCNVLDSYGTLSVDAEHREGHTWLPYQHQLQDILNYSSAVALLGEFWLFCRPLHGRLFNHYITMEQFLISFVMSKKFNKIWCDKTEAWVMKNG